MIPTLQLSTQLIPTNSSPQHKLSSPGPLSRRIARSSLPTRPPMAKEEAENTLNSPKLHQFPTESPHTTRTNEPHGHKPHDHFSCIFAQHRSTHEFLTCPMSECSARISKSRSTLQAARTPTRNPESYVIPVLNPILALYKMRIKQPPCNYSQNDTQGCR
ncbi:hypothetical protein PROFUN_12499 [Planoprotostelium fungivorum]|uniref:Uncharacterized protein n=1 Tax=Planoprotostelium fungivorum TaxID=1890364 RepID=A0A2P6N7B2_9EUKA|nr:hypothetical protein PROFUN_12499 [Planoprotostelium fungivorum]